MPNDITPDPDGNIQPISPAGTDVLNAAAFVLHYQRFANWVSNITRGFKSTSGEWTYHNYTTGLAEPKARTTRYLADGFKPVVSGSIIAGPSEGSIALATDSALYQMTLRVPEGATMGVARILVVPGAARTGTNRVGLSRHRRTGISFTSPAAGTITSPVYTYDDGTTGIQSVFVSLGNSYQNSEPEMITIKAGNTATSSADIIYAVEVTWNDPGPRNF